MISTSASLSCFLAVVATLLLSSPAAAQIVRPDAVDCANVTAPDGADFLSLLRDIEAQGIVSKIDASLRVYPFEVLTAAQTGNLNGLLQTLGYVRLLSILDALTEEYSHRFSSFLVKALDSEDCQKSS